MFALEGECGCCADMCRVTSPPCTAMRIAYAPAVGG